MNSADQIEQLKSEVNELLVIVRNLTAEIISLRKENTLQKAELDIYRSNSESKPNKTSGNSSLPPSHDIVPVKRNQSLRKQGIKKSGGQLNHKGTTLEQIKHPGNIIKKLPNWDCCCGYTLSSRRLYL